MLVKKSFTRKTNTRCHDFSFWRSSSLSSALLRAVSQESLNTAYGLRRSRDALLVFIVVIWLIIPKIRPIRLYVTEFKYNYMQEIPNSTTEAVSDKIENTYPTYRIGSYSNLVKIKNPDKIRNSSRFWNDRSEEMLNAINDINDTFYHFPDKQKLKILSSKHYQRLFDEVFLFLDNRISSTTKHTRESRDEVAMIVKLSEKFLKIGLEGIEKTMPDEFDEILETKIKDIMLHVKSISKLTERLSPKKSNEVSYDFDYYLRGKIRTKWD